ncbi:MAG: bacteriohemerythrin [Thermodesulfobacteriota bacterium]
MATGKIVWEDGNMSVKIAEIDQQHKALVNLINNLFDAIKEGKSNQIFEKLISDLIKYTQFHFSTEEKYFTQHAYPETQLHKAKHQEFVETVLRFKKDFDAGKTGLTMGILDFLRDWLVKHIMGEDRKYSAFLLSKGVR